MTHAHHLAMFTKIQTERERLVPPGIGALSRRQREKLRKEEKKLSTSTATTNPSLKSGLLPLPSASAYRVERTPPVPRAPATPARPAAYPIGFVVNGRREKPKEAKKGREASRSSQTRTRRSKEGLRQSYEHRRDLRPEHGPGHQGFLRCLHGKSASTKPCGRGHMARAV